MQDTCSTNRAPIGANAMGRVGLLLGGALLAGAALTGCETRQVAVISLTNRAPAATGLGVYYKLNDPAFKSAGVRGNLDRFGIEAPLGTEGDLEAHVFAYANDVPCILSSGSGAVHMPGEYRQNLTIDMATTTSVCNGGKEPVDFPTAKMAVYARNTKDIWFVGDQGKILRWDGERYTRMALPGDLAKTPPNWNAITGTVRGDVFMVGTNGTVVRWTGTALEQITISSGGGPLPGLVWRDIAVGQPSLGDLWLAGNGGAYGYYNVGLGNQVTPGTFECTVGVPFKTDLNAVSCVTLKTGIDCWYAGDGGAILRLVPGTTKPNCYIYPSKTTENLQGIWVAANTTQGLLDVRAVGARNAIVRGSALLSDPIPFPVFESYATYLAPGFMSNFTSIGSTADSTGGNSSQTVWVTGSNGVVLRWDDTPQIPKALIPFALINTGGKSTFEKLSAVPTGVFATGPSNTLFYTGSLFSPM